MLDGVAGLLNGIWGVGVIQFINRVNINFKLLCILAIFGNMYLRVVTSFCSPDLLTLYHKLESE
jgi:hypothetical protein